MESNLNRFRHEASASFAKFPSLTRGLVQKISGLCFLAASLSINANRLTGQHAATFHDGVSLQFNGASEAGLLAWLAL